MKRLRLPLIAKGFTLVEIAIVLVIIGLLIGGILRGQELINTAKVRSIISQQSSIQTAIFTFVDRYKVLPGDLTTAEAAIVNSATTAASIPGNGVIDWQDGIFTFQNLASAGLINCANCLLAQPTDVGTATIGGGTNPAKTLLNPFGQPLYISTYYGGANANNYLDPANSFTAPIKTNLSTGYGLAGSILAEVDRKLDDGWPASGSFRFGFNAWQTPVGLSTPGIFNSCLTTNPNLSNTSAQYYAWTNVPGTNCDGVLILM